MFLNILKNKNKEKVNHPKHYNFGSIEVIQVIEDWNLDFSLGNTIKYIGRAGYKDPNKKKEDLQKALWYLKRSISYYSSKENLFNDSIIGKKELDIDDILSDWNLSDCLSKAVTKIYLSLIENVKTSKLNLLELAAQDLEKEILYL